MFLDVVRGRNPTLFQRNTIYYVPISGWGGRACSWWWWGTGTLRCSQGTLPPQVAILKIFFNDTSKRQKHCRIGQKDTNIFSFGTYQTEYALVFITGMQHQPTRSMLLNPTLVPANPIPGKRSDRERLDTVVGLSIDLMSDWLTDLVTKWTESTNLIYHFLYREPAYPPSVNGDPTAAVDTAMVTDTAMSVDPTNYSSIPTSHQVMSQRWLNSHKFLKCPAKKTHIKLHFITKMGILFVHNNITI